MMLMSALSLFAVCLTQLPTRSSRTTSVKLVPFGIASRCKQKGVEQHPGFGFVHFAVKEDAIRAVEIKNGASLQGRKIKVELAKRRAPLDTRHPKGKRKDLEKTAVEDGAVETTEALVPEPKDKEAKKRKAADSENKHPIAELSRGAVVDRKIKDAKIPAVKGLPKDSKKRPREVGKASNPQRTARTVVIGCLENPKMVEAAIAKAKKLDTVEDVRRPVPEAELISRDIVLHFMMSLRRKILNLRYRFGEGWVQGRGHRHRLLFSESSMSSCSGSSQAECRRRKCYLGSPTWWRGCEAEKMATHCSKSSLYAQRTDLASAILVVRVRLGNHHS